MSNINAINLQPIQEAPATNEISSKEFEPQPKEFVVPPSKEFVRPPEGFIPPVRHMEAPGDLYIEKQQSSASTSDSIVKDVWIENFFTSMETISELIDEYNYIAMDTEFPGTIYIPTNTQHEFEYQIIKANCDNLKLIQVGISLANQDGELPRGKTVAWQFNLFFDLEKEQCINESIKLLKESGFLFDKHKTDGIPHKLFAEYLISSGLVLNRRNHWITFHGAHDFGYLLKILIGQNLPNFQDEFLYELQTYFVNCYDCKEIKREMDDPYGGLGKAAKEFDIERIGTLHQGGSDAYVTNAVFFKLRSKLKSLWIETESKIEERLNGKIYGIGDSMNFDQYIEQYKYCAKKVEYIDSTGYVNLKLYTLGKQGSGSSSNAQNSTIPQSTTHQGLGVTHHNSGGSSHGMLATNPLNLNNIPINEGHNSGIGMQSHQNQWVNQSTNVEHSGHGMIGNPPNNNHNMNNMVGNHTNHSASNTQVDMSNQYVGNMMQNNQAQFDMNSINQTNLLAQLNQIPNITNYATQNNIPNIGMNQQQNQLVQNQVNLQLMPPQQQQQMLNNQSINQNPIEDHTDHQNQQFRMLNNMQQNNSGGQHTQQPQHQNHQQAPYMTTMTKTLSSNNQTGNQQQQFPTIHQNNQFGYSQQQHQQLLEASQGIGGNQIHFSGGTMGSAQREPHPHSSPQIMNQGQPAPSSYPAAQMMNPNTGMANHQQIIMQQQQQHNNYYNQQNQYGHQNQ